MTDQAERTTSQKRQLTYVDRKVQGTLAKRLIIHWCLFFLVVTFFSLAIEWLSDPFTTFHNLLTQAWDNHSPFLLVTLVLVPVFIYDAMRLSGRFAGPVFRLRRTIRKITETGRPVKLRFRKDDFWKDLAVDFDRMVMRLIQSHATAIGEDLTASEATEPPNASPGRREPEEEAVA